MKNLSFVLVTLVMFITSCSNGKELEILFPLGITLNEAMDDDVIKSRICRTDFYQEEEMEDEFNCFKEYIYKEDNFKTFDFKGTTCLRLKEYVKDGVLYDRVFLFFKNNKLVQVYAKAERRKNISFVNIKMASFPKYKEKTFEKGVKFEGDEEAHSIPYEVFQYKSGRTYFEKPKEFDDNEVYFIYYTKKINALAGFY